MTAARLIVSVAAFATCLVYSVAAQEPEPEPTAGIRLDFQGVELGIVLSALAEAGELNVTYSEIPPTRVTLQMARPVGRDEVLPLLRSLAASNGLRVEEEGPIIRIEPAEPSIEATATEEPQDVAESRLFVHRLRHARASRLAATLQAMFGGAAKAPAPAGIRPSLSEQLRDQRIAPLETDNPEQDPDVDVQLEPPGAPGIPGRLGGEVLIVPDEATNALLVRASPDDWAVLQEAIEALDLRPYQVLIEVLIVEVRRTSDLGAGVTGEFSHVTGDDDEVSGSLTGLTAGDVALRLMTGGSTMLTGVLTALSRSGDVRIVSRPVVVAQNNQEARILIGEQRPFVQVFRSLPTDAGVRDQVVQFRDVGTSLSITPTINDDGYVNLQVFQEVSTATAEEQFGAPVISTREASTRLFVRDGQTVVIGGMIDRQQQETRSGIPLLKDIPILGYVFGSTQRIASLSELFIFLTPHVIADDLDADRARERVEEETEFLPDLLPWVDPADGVPDSGSIPPASPGSSRKEGSRDD